MKSDTVSNKPVYHVIGKGKTTGFASIFFKVDDTYESYFDKVDGRPYKFIRKIDEGGYTKDIEIDFDHDRDVAVLNDKKNKKKFNFTLDEEIQDLISAFYYLRNHYDPEKLVVGKSIELQMLYDDDGIFPFRLKFLGKEVLKTKFGKVECLKFRPICAVGPRIPREGKPLPMGIQRPEPDPHPHQGRPQCGVFEGRSGRIQWP